MKKKYISNTLFFSLLTISVYNNVEAAQHEEDILKQPLEIILDKLEELTKGQGNPECQQNLLNCKIAGTELECKFKELQQKHLALLNKHRTLQEENEKLIESLVLQKKQAMPHFKAEDDEDV